MILRKLYYILSSWRSRNIDRREIREFQKRNLENIVQYTGNYSSFYARRWKNAGFDPEDFQSLEDLQDAPIIDKKSVREKKDELKTSIQGISEYSSTGSLGDSFTVPFDEQAADWREAITVRTEICKGYRPRNRIVELLGKPQTKTGKLLRPKASVPKNDSIEKQIEFLQSEDPDYLIYGAHNLFRICKKLKSREEHSINIKGVFSVGELLTPAMRETIGEVLDAEIHSVYETSEVGQIAWECPEGGYHINEDLVHLEVLDDSGNKVEPGERGHAVVTGLVNRAFPLIRYRIGDTLIKGSNDCSCNTHFDKIERIEGRTDNFIPNERGEDIAPREIVDALAKFENLEKFVFEKENNNYRVRYESGDHLKEKTLQKVEKRLSELGFTDITLKKENSIDKPSWKAIPVRNLD